MSENVNMAGDKITVDSLSVSGLTDSGTATVSSVTIGTAGPQILVGAGAPTSVTAPKGSFYLNTTGSSTSTRAYINTDSGTTWTAVTTAA
jgi:hypothetical protein